MREVRTLISGLTVGLSMLLAFTAPAFAQIPLPAPDPTGLPNIFYGAVPPAPPEGTAEVRADVLVFVHGLGGTADNWWLANNTYQKAYEAGYRTAFIGLSPDNTSNNDSAAVNGAKLQAWLPMVAARYGVSKMVLIGHSKGGVDLQVAMTSPAIINLVKAFIAIDSPNSGTELANWAFGPGAPVAGPLGLLNPGVFSLRTDVMEPFRAQVDPVFKASGIPFYTMTGTKFLDNPVTAITGAVLRNLVPDEQNDGFVTVSRGRLPTEYSTEIELLNVSHFLANNGDIIVPKIDAALKSLNTTLAELKRIQSNGFSDANNTWIWSLDWFQGKVFAGTGREITCVSLLTSDVQQGTNIYGLAAIGGACPEESDLPRRLGAEIWSFDPATGEWTRVFKSPDTIQIGVDDLGNPVMTGRDIGFRGMHVFTEAGGTEALYVGGVTSGSIYSHLPEFASGYPPPRILRSTDGVNFEPIPQTPGTFLGDIGLPNTGGENKTIRSMRGLSTYKGMLFVGAGTFDGVGRMIASANPSAGDNAWFFASGTIDEMPVWDHEEFANRLYVTTGNKEEEHNPGYAVFYTDATGPAPYQWIPVVGNGGWQSDPAVRGPNGLSMEVFKDQLYVGTNRPTELIRINADGTWDLLVGEARDTPFGRKTPLTGLGIGFGSWFNGHFWRMASHDGYLYLGTWDWSSSARLLGDDIADIFRTTFGFDLYRTTDGIHWQAVTRWGMGEKYNIGARTLKSTPIGLFLGSARGQGGGQIFRCAPPACTDQELDSTPPAPSMVEAQSEELSGRTANISWLSSPGAIRYRVYRATVRAVADFLPGASSFSFKVPGLPQPLTLDLLMSNEFKALCRAPSPAMETACVLARAVQADVNTESSVPEAFQQVAIVSGTSYSEPAPTVFNSLYYVRAEDAEGRLSRPSNFVGAPSKTAANPADATPPVVTAVVTPQANAAGWHNGPVVVRWLVSDPETNILSAAGCAPTLLTKETDGITVTCTAKNGFGLSALRSVTVRIDATAPVVTFGSIAPAANTSGWHNTDVEIPFEVSDNLSGAMSVSASSPLVFSAEGSHVASVTVSDLAGNEATYACPPVRIDKTAPEAYAFFDPNAADLLVFGVDGGSGVAGGAVAASSGARPEIGVRTYEVSDLAGNTLTLVVDVKRAGHSVKAQILRLEYGAGPAARTSFDVPDNGINVEYSAGLTEITQKMSVGRGGDRQETEAKYQGKKDETQIKVKQAGEGAESKITESGRRLLRMRTVNGQLIIDRGL